MAAVKPYLKGKLDSRRGEGGKMVLAYVTISPQREALHCTEQYVQMRSIKQIICAGRGTEAACVMPNVVSPGSYNNYCSFTVARIRIGDGTAAVIQRVKGTITLPMLIIGD